MHTVLSPRQSLELSKEDLPKNNTHLFLAHILQLLSKQMYNKNPPTANEMYNCHSTISLTSLQCFHTTSAASLTPHTSPKQESNNPNNPTSHHRSYLPNISLFSPNPPNQVRYTSPRYLPPQPSTPKPNRLRQNHPIPSSHP